MIRIEMLKSKHIKSSRKDKKEKQTNKAEEEHKKQQPRVRKFEQQRS